MCGVEGGADERQGPRDALRVPAYRRWFVAQVFSASGALTQLVGMSWLVVGRTDSGLALGALTFGIYLPVLVLGPWAGRIVDRADRRILLLIAQAAFTAIGAALVLVAWTGTDSLAVLYAIALLTGVVNAIDAPARQVYLMDVLPRRMLPTAIGLYEVVMNAARVLGPAVAGILLAVGGVVPCFLFNAVSFLPAVYALVRNRGASAYAAPRVAGAPRSSVWAGLRWSFARPRILVMLVLGSIGGMLFNLSATVPLVATQAFGLDGGGYGLLTAAFGVGALTGAFRAATQRGAPRAGPTVALALATGALVVLAALAPTAWTFAIGLAAAGATGIWFIARANTYVQLAAPDAIRGQVMGAWNMAIPGMNPFTGLAAGALADALTARAGFALSGTLFLAVAGAALLIATIPRRRL